MANVSLGAFPLAEQRFVVDAMERLGLDVSELRIAKTDFLACAAIGGANALVTVVLGGWSRTYPACKGRNWVEMFVKDVERLRIRKTASPAQRSPGTSTAMDVFNPLPATVGAPHISAAKRIQFGFSSGQH